MTNDEPKYFYFYSWFSQIFDPFDSYENYPEEKNRYRESILVTASSRHKNDGEKKASPCLNVKWHSEKSGLH